MKHLILITASLVASASLLHSEDKPEELKLWPQGAPEARGDKHDDQPWLDFYPASEKPNGAAMVVLPGGGYGGLAADHEGRQIALYFNTLGVSAFVLHYRLGSHDYHHPIEMNDAKRAIRWVRANAAAHGGDVARIGVIGFSAGGHLAATAATLFDDGDANAADPVDRVSSRPDCAVLCYPVIAMAGEFSHRGSRNNLLGPQKDDEELAVKVSAQNNVSARTPPTFIFQTDEDTVVPAENAVSFYLALRKHHVPAEMHIYQHGPHGVGLMQGDPILSTWGGHLSAWLRNMGFFSASKRSAVKGTASINGKPVSWGAVVFTPDDTAAPRPTARIMGGKFTLDAKNGPVIGRNKLRVVFSANDVPALAAKDAPDGVMELSTESPKHGAALMAEIKEETNVLKLELRWE